MPIQVQLPDGTIGEFPDGMPDAEIEKVLQRQFGAPASAPAATAAETFDPTQGMSAYEKFMAGAGKSVNDTWNGLRQISGSIGDAIPGVDLTDWRAGVQADIDEARRIDAPLMSTGWGMTGNIAGQAAQAAIPVGGAVGRAGAVFGRAAPYAGAATRGAALSAAQPIAGDESRLMNALIGGSAGAVGQGIASGASALASRAGAAISPAIQRSIDAAQKAGIPLRAAQVSGSQFLKTLQSAMDALPFSGGGAMARKQQEGFNRALGRTFGADAPYLTDDVMLAARQNIGQSYNDIYSRNNIDLDQPSIQRMLGIENLARMDLAPDNAQIVSNQFQKVIDAFANGRVAGPLYQDLRGALNKVVDDSSTGRLVAALRGELDAAASRSVGPADAQALKQANSQWANMRTAEDALKQASGGGGQAGGAAGNVRPASLYPLVRNGSTPELRELAQIGQNVLKDPIPNSGTAQRELIYSALGLGGGGYLATNENPWLQALGGGLLAGRAMNSPYLAKALLAAGPANQAILNGTARLAAPAPSLMPALANALRAPAAPMDDAPLVIDVAGGTVGPAPTVEQLEALRRRGLPQ